MAPRRTFISLAAAVCAFAIVASAQERDRSKVLDKYKWDLTHIYASDDAWKQAKEKIAAEIPKVREFKGTLASSAGRLADALELASRLSKELGRTYVYASMMSDTDTRVAKYQGMQQEMIQLATTMSAEAAFIEPEILKADRATIEKFVASEPRLKPYRLYLDDIQRRAPHTLTDAEEKLLASAGVIASAPSTTYGIFSDADFPYPSVTLSDGKSVRLDSSGFSLHRASPNRDDRKKVMAEFFGALGKYRGTFGSTLNGQIESDIFFARARKYPNALEAALDSPNLPTTVYTRLLDGVNRHLPTFHRYLKLRQRMMKLQDLHYYDLYAPLVASVDLAYSIDDAQKLGAMMLFGEKYGDEVRVLDIGSSRELCGGTHVARTGDIGPFRIVSEGGVAAGVRRVEAIAGTVALAFARQESDRLARVADALKAQPSEVEAKLAQALENTRALEKELARLKVRMATSQGQDLASTAVDVKGVKVLTANLEGADVKTLRETLDKLKDKLKSSAIVLASAEGEKVSLIAGVTQDLISKVKAGELVNFVASQVGGKGGGRPDMAQAGGTDSKSLPKALASVQDWVAERL